MKFFRPVIILFLVLYVPLLTFCVLSAPPNVPRETALSKFGVGLLVILLPISLGYGFLSSAMDKQQASARASEQGEK